MQHERKLQMARARFQNIAFLDFLCCSFKYIITKY